MNATEQAVLDALLELDAAVKLKSGAGPKPSLAPLLARLDKLAVQLPPGSDEELRHFLQQRSYEKALIQLRGERAASGTCGL
ncbi:MAG TPA: hypothetical protein VI454_13295 [Verrucomicrobiae bacterium]|jgi:hypothetical protein